MSTWNFRCQNCNRNFPHSTVEPEPRQLHDSLWPYRPELPNTGVQMKCPNCQASATYHRWQLTFAAE